MRYLLVNIYNPPDELWFFIPLTEKEKGLIGDRADLFNFTRKMTPWDPVRRMSFDTRVTVGRSVPNFPTSNTMSWFVRDPEPGNPEESLFLNIDPESTPVTNITGADQAIIENAEQPAILTLTASDGYDASTYKGLYLRWDVIWKGPESYQQAYEDWPLEDYVQIAGPLPPTQRRFTRW